MGADEFAAAVRVAGSPTSVCSLPRRARPAGSVMHVADLEAAPCSPVAAPVVGWAGARGAARLRRRRRWLRRGRWAGATGLRAPFVEGARLLRQVAADHRRATGAVEDGGGGLLARRVPPGRPGPGRGATCRPTRRSGWSGSTRSTCCCGRWWLLGWGANSTWGLVGGYRFLAQALAYEIPLMFALTGPALAAGSLRMTDVVAAQQGLWFVVGMPVAALVYALGVVAFAAWGPSRTPAGADAVGGVLAELSGPDRLVGADRSVRTAGVRRCGGGAAVPRRRCRPAAARAGAGCW